MITFIIKSAEIFDMTQRHLGAIAKRATDDNGNKDFDMFMLQSNETELIDQYVGDATRRICALAPEKVHHYNITETGSYVFYIDGGRERNYNVDSSDIEWEPKTAKPIGEEGSDKYLLTNAAIGYVVNHVIAQYLSMAAPKFAEKYIAEAANTLADLQRILFIKEPPTSAYSLSDTTGSCS